MSRAARASTHPNFLPFLSSHSLNNTEQMTEQSSSSAHTKYDDDEVDDLEDELELEESMSLLPTTFDEAFVVDFHTDQRAPTLILNMVHSQSLLKFFFMGFFTGDGCNSGVIRGFFLRSTCFGDLYKLLRACGIQKPNIRYEPTSYILDHIIIQVRGGL